MILYAFVGDSAGTCVGVCVEEWHLMMTLYFSIYEYVHFVPTLCTGVPTDWHHGRAAHPVKWPQTQWTRSGCGHQGQPCLQVSTMGRHVVVWDSDRGWCMQYGRYFNCPFVHSPHSYPMCCSMQNTEWTRNWSPPHCYSREGLTQSLHVSSAAANVSWIAGLIVNYSCNNCHGCTMECSYIRTYPMHRPSLLSSFSPSLRMSHEVYSSPCLLALAYIK